MRKDIRGQRFNRLTVLEDSGKRACNGGIIWSCICSCGNFTDVRSSHLRSGRTKSCGCFNRDKGRTWGLGFFRHGYNTSNSRLYGVWAAMKQRCYNPKNPFFKHYGGRGIEMCQEWKGDFLVFRDWALSNGYESNLTIDKINNDDNYYPENCQWITLRENVLKGSNQYPVTGERPISR